VIERTFIMAKPDVVRRNLIGEVCARIERSGLRIAAMKMMRVDRALAERHYAEHKGKQFYEPLLEYITSGPVVSMVVVGENAIQNMRDLMGKTDPAQAAKGTIRGDYGSNIQENVVHGSDSSEKAKREIGLFFSDDEIVNYSSL
jgi:nucleoside-diphosphate kinase